MPDKLPKKSKRISMQGMGADAFFGPPVQAEEEIPVSKSSGLPVDQQSSILARQPNSTPAFQEAIVPARQENDMPVKPHTDMPVSQQGSTPDKQDLIKATYYIRPEQDIKLEQIRLQRRLRGEKIDKSALIREAIDKLLAE